MHVVAECNALARLAASGRLQCWTVLGFLNFFYEEPFVWFPVLKIIWNLSRFRLQFHTIKIVEPEISFWVWFLKKKIKIKIRLLVPVQILKIGSRFKLGSY